MPSTAWPRFGAFSYDFELGETADLLTRFKDRFVIAHLKDVSPDGAEANTRAFGNGVFPFPVYLEFPQRQRPDLPIIIEHQSIETIPATIDGVRRLIGALS